MDFKTKKIAPVGEIKRPAGVMENPNFRRWFGDSKMLDADGQPLVLYHGTDRAFREFVPSRHGEYGGGIYLSFRPESAALWAQLAGGRGGETTVMPLYVRMVKPFIVSKAELHALALEEGPDEEPIGMNEVHRRLKEQGYDGIIGTGLVESDKQIIVFESTQTKSAVANCGMFDPKDPDIES